MKIRFSLILSILIFSGCSFDGSYLPPQLPSIPDSRYQNAVRDAAVAEESEIARDLVAINADNRHLIWNPDRTKILVVTWKSQDAYEGFIKPNQHTSSGEANATWVTAAPQTQQFCQIYIRNNPGVTKETLELRLKQFLGLNPEWQYDVFVEMWVSPSDLFRPCVDPEVNDSACELTFKNPPPEVKGIGNYPNFFKNLYFADFRSLPGVPWTGLGYTYDWGNALTTKGASEFIMVPGTSYQIEKATPTAEYCSLVEERP